MHTGIRSLKRTVQSREAQSVKHLSCKCENMSLRPQNSHGKKKAEPGGPYWWPIAEIPGLGRWQQDPWDFWVSQPRWLDQQGTLSKNAQLNSTTTKGQPSWGLYAHTEHTHPYTTHSHWGGGGSVGDPHLKVEQICILRFPPPPIYLQFIKSEIAFMLRFLILYLARIIFWITVQLLDQTAWVKSKFYY